MSTLFKAQKNSESRSGAFGRMFLSTTAMMAVGLAALSTGQAQADTGPWTEWDTQNNFTLDSNGQTTNIHTTADIAGGNSPDLDIDVSEKVNVFQKGSGSLFYGRAADDADPTQILGTLWSNGRLLIIDRNGVFFGSGSRVDAAGLMASTGDIADEDIFDGDDKFTFDNFGEGQIVVYDGAQINVPEAGLVAFVSPFVTNNGVISAKMGTVAFAAGEQVTLDLYGDGLVEVAVDGELADALLENKGEIHAEGGTVHMSASAVKNAVDNIINVEGIMTVASAEMKGGKIILNGGDHGTVSVSGKLEASGTDGGSIKVTGGEVNLASTAELKADGALGGKGGNILTLAKNRSEISGKLSAQGEGGFIETSAHDLRINDDIDVRAPHWLIDPMNLLIDNSIFATITANTLSTILNWGITDITITTAFPAGQAGILALGDTVQWTSDSSLSLIADSDMYFANTTGVAGIYAGGAGNVNLDAGGNILLFSGFGIGTNGGDVSMNAGEAIGLGSGLITTNGGDANFHAGTSFSLLATSAIDTTTGTGEAGDVTVRADSVDVAGKINAGDAMVTMGRETDGLLNIGDSYGSTFHISQGELDNITAGTLVFGVQGNGADNTIKVINADTTHIAKTIFNTEIPEGPYDVNFLGHNKFNELEVNAEDDIQFGDDASVEVFGDAVFNADSDHGGAGDFIMGTGSSLRSNGHDITVSTGSFGGLSPDVSVFLGSGASIDAQGGNVDFNNEGNFFSVDADSIRTSGTGTIELEQFVKGPLGGTIQNAVDAIENTGTGSNTINVHAGTYAESVSIYEDNFNLLGAALNSIITPSSPGFHVTGNNTLIDGFTIDGADNGVLIDGADNVVISNNLIKNSSHDGVKVVSSTNVDLLGNEINNSAWVGVELVNSDTVLIDDNTIDGALDGILSGYSDHVVVSNNTVENSTYDGVDIDGGSDISIVDNTINNSGDNAVELWDLTGAIVDGNTIDGAATGVDVSYSMQTEVTNNTITDVDYGVVADNSANILISGNDITGSSTVGIDVNNSAGAQISSNVVTHFTTGIRVANSDEAAIEGNTISDIKDNGIEVLDSDLVDVVGNEVSDTGNDGVRVKNSDNIDIRSNNIHDVGDDGVHATNSDYARIRWNNIRRTGQHSFDGEGVQLAGGSDYATISGNILTNIGDDAVDIDGGRHNTVSHNIIFGARGDGIDLDGGAHAVVRGNIIGLVGQDGVDADGIDGLKIKGNWIFGTKGDGVSVDDSTDVNVARNRIYYAGDHGIDVRHSDNVRIHKNDIYNAGRDGIHASDIRADGQFFALKVTENNVIGSGDDGIEIRAVKHRDTTNILVDKNHVEDSGDNGILLVARGGKYHHGAGYTGFVNSLITDNLVENSGSNGLHVKGYGHGDVVLKGNTFIDNPVGARFESGRVDVSDLSRPNNFIVNPGYVPPHKYDYVTGMQFDLARSHQPTSLTIAGETLGNTIFEGFINRNVGDAYYVRFEDGAILDAVGNVIEIDGTAVSWDGFVPADNLDINGHIPAAALNAIEDRLWDADDPLANGRGQIFVGTIAQPTLENVEDFFNRFDPYGAGLQGLKVTVTGLPPVGLGPTNLAGIEPAAGGEGEGEGEGGAQNLAGIEPAAGGEEATCWSDALNAAGTGAVVNFDWNGTFEESLNSAVNCGSQSTL